MSAAGAAGVREGPLQSAGSTTCPLCQTAGPLAGDDRLRPGVGWRCAVCGQAWDVNRLATVAAYTVYAADRTAAHRPARATGARVPAAPLGGV